MSARRHTIRRLPDMYPGRGVTRCTRCTNIVAFGKIPTRLRIGCSCRAQNVPIRYEFNFFVAVFDKHVFWFTRAVLVGSTLLPSVGEIASGATRAATFDVMSANSRFKFRVIGSMHVPCGVATRFVGVSYPWFSWCVCQS